jgi:hypothetical protein
MIVVILVLELVMRTFRTKAADDRGAALVSSLLALMLMAAITAGFTALVITDTRVRSMDNTRTQAFYTAHAGLEKMTSDLGDLFAVNFAPTAAQINALANTPPAMPGVTWLRPDGTDGYTTTFPVGGGGNPQASIMTVMSGPFQGLVGLATPYQMNVTARLQDGSEAQLTRTLQSVAIPVFQFGLFSENDLSFFAGPNFNFGGRVHSNQSIYLAQGDGTTLTLADRVTAVGEIIRTHLSNNWDTNFNYNGAVRAITAPNAFRNLAKNEGSLVANVFGQPNWNEPRWTNLSTGAYNHNIANSRTGAKRLDLPVVNFGGAPIDLIRRPVQNENVTNPNMLGQRFYSLASIRILLSDTAADINNLPGIGPGNPVPLGSAAPWALGANSLPFANSPGPQLFAPNDCAAAAGNTIQAARCGSRTPGGNAVPATNTPLLGGFIKVEMADAGGIWQDVTMEILNLGISGKQLDVAGCADPSPNAVIRLQHLRDRLSNVCVTVAGSAAALYSGANAPFNYSPNVLYDVREGVQRDNAAAGDPIRFGGIFHYVELDVNNLRRWLQGAIGASGPNALNVNGFTVYFSDRRGNRDAGGAETGEYGFEDLVNPDSATGAPNGALDVGEDFNNNGVLDTYGQNPKVLPLVPGAAAADLGLNVWAAPFAVPAAVRPWLGVAGADVNERAAIAQRNPPAFFRRALKLTNGSLGNIIGPGLAIASENPLYVQGNWNANNAGFGNPHVATSLLADAVSVVSNNWNDRQSLLHPYDFNSAGAGDGRIGTTTWYRMAVISGKGLAFPQPAVGAPPRDYGTDGGAHNFLRYIENWGGQALNYRGSIASMFYSRQATSTYKCCTNVYSPPTRGYNFDTDFLTPALLPPRTPMFRDINTTGFAQIIRPQ